MRIGIYGYGNLGRGIVQHLYTIYSPADSL